jgi:NADPH:quinone reductase-like Zn-dependent oxidoreductase
MENKLMPRETSTSPSYVRAIGYTRAPNGLPLETFDHPVRAPAPDELLVHVVSSSLNPLDYKLAALNFLGRTPPVALGFDFAGVVHARGDGVTRFAVGDAVFGMAPSNRDGVWVQGGAGGYALVPQFLVARKPESLSFMEAGALGVCFLSAHLAFQTNLTPGNTVYIPGGGGGVGHLAIQKARALDAGLIISSGGNAGSRSLAKAVGATHVFDYRHDDIAGEIAELTGGRGVDVVFDATYSEESFASTASMVRPGGRWIVLGVGPGKTKRTVDVESPVAGILAARGAEFLTVNLLQYFSSPEGTDASVKALLTSAIEDAAAFRPHISAIIPSEADAINAAIADMQAGRRAFGKIAVVVDTARAEWSHG